MYQSLKKSISKLFLDLQMVPKQLTASCKKINVDTDLTPFIKLIQKWSQMKYAKHKIIKILEDNIGEKQNDLRDDDNTISKVQSMKEITDTTSFSLWKTVSREW